MSHVLWQLDNWLDLDRPQAFVCICVSSAFTGLGMFEYMLLCDALGATPVWVVNAGTVADPNHSPNNWIQDALDSIDFILGDTSTTYGAVRSMTLSFMTL